MTTRVDGRRALVTGSSEGIGRAIALALAEAGADLILHGLPGPEAEESLDLVRATGARADFVAADLGDATALAVLADRAADVDILVSNVAVHAAQPLGQVDADAMDRQFAVNFKGTVALIQAALPRMRAQRWGRIVTIGSVQEVRPHPDMLAYAALKSAQTNLVRNIARQVAADGVTVNNIAPGVIDTRRNTAALADQDYLARVMERIPARVIGRPEDVAGAALLLCSDAGRYITGVSLPVDGGMSL